MYSFEVRGLGKLEFRAKCLGVKMQGLEFVVYSLRDLGNLEFRVKSLGIEV